MARFNEILSGRFNRALQKLFSMKGEPPAPQLASEIIPIIPMFYGVECRYLEGWNRFVFSQSSTGGAGQNAAVRLRIPPNIGALAVVEKILVANPAGASTSYNILVSPNGIQVDLSNLVVAAQIAAFDSRGSLNSVCIPSFTTNLAPVSPTMSLVLPAGTSQDLIVTDDQEIPLITGPASNGGAAITISDNTVAQQMNVTMVWRERVIEDSEKNLGGGGVG